jgi:hypothetical protein
MRLDGNLKLLERHGFILRRQDEIAEGPLLDVLLDYEVMAPRILNGALADVLAREQAQQQEQQPVKKTADDGEIAVHDNPPTEA